MTCITDGLHQEDMYPHPDRHVIHANSTHDRMMICDKEERRKKKPTYVSHHQAYPILSYPILLSFICHHTSTANKASYSSVASITCITYGLHQEHMYPHPYRHVINTNSTHDRMIICDKEERRRSPRTSAITKPVLSFICHHTSNCDQSLVFVPRLYHMHYLLAAPRAYVSTSRPTRYPHQQHT